VIAEPGWGIDPVFSIPDSDCRYCGQPCRTYRPGTTFVLDPGCVKLRRRIFLVATIEIKTEEDLEVLEERVHDEAWWRRHEDPHYHEDE
jgi:hypothetical protein